MKTQVTLDLCPVPDKSQDLLEEAWCTLAVMLLEQCQSDEVGSESMVTSGAPAISLQE